MHFVILVEDQSGKKMISAFIDRIIGNEHTVRIINYRGIGRIPKNLRTTQDSSKRILLEQLPKLLKGYGVSFKNSPDDFVVFVVCDLDNRCLKEFRQELFSVLNSVNTKPKTRFCIAVEESEAWLLGDIEAIRKAYPKAKKNVLNEYENDSVCGTWEKIADAVYPGGSQKLSKYGFAVIGAEKSKWAEKISPHVDVENNKSPSFRYFRDKMRELAH